MQDFPNTALTLLKLSLTLIPLYLIGLLVYNAYFHPLAKYPGPKSMAATRLPYIRMIISGRFPHKMKALHQQYGKVVRIAPDELSFIDGEAWKAIYGTRVGHGQKSKDYRFYGPTAGGVPSIIVSNDADHSRFRRLLSHAFSDSSLRGQEPIIKGYVDLLMQRLHENIKGGTNTVDMVAWYNFTTFDIIGDLAFGEPFDCLKNSDYHQWVSIIFSAVKYAAYTNVARRVPGWTYIMPYITPKHVISHRSTHLALTNEKVQSRITKSNDRPDFFGNILKHQNTEKGFSIPEMITNGSTLIIAGSETTATLLSGVTYLLARNPRVLAKLQDEIRSTFTKEEEITLESCNKLDYCLAVLTEALRVYPPVAVGLPRIVDSQGDMIAGNWVPGGTIVSVSNLAASHSPANFTDAEQFAPERHLGDSRFANDSKSAMQPFSFGPRNCIGRNLAYVEMRIILARMVFNFDMELDQPEEDWADQECFLLWEKPKLMMKLKPRRLYISFISIYKWLLTASAISAKKKGTADPKRKDRLESAKQFDIEYKETNMSLSKSESDVILNRANVALSRSQRLVASWLPQQTTEELANPKTDEELQREEDEIFTAVPETLGVGAPLPQKAADGSWNRTELDSNDKLRKQLLGKNYDRVMKAAAEQKAAAAASTAAAAAASANVVKAEVQDEYDEEDGRSAMLARQKNKRKGGVGAGRGVHPAAAAAAAAAAAEAGDKGGEEGEGEGAPPPVRSKGRKKATSYLDELLAERAKKRKKR
ncbi:Cytochrome P450 [Penicillium expansum]|nr:Cytochrome P450 [Penicillium expansum]